MLPLSFFRIPQRSAPPPPSRPCPPPPPSAFLYGQLLPGPGQDRMQERELSLSPGGLLAAGKMWILPVEASPRPLKKPWPGGSVGF